MDGLIIINKEKGYTSRDVVNVISKTLGIKKVGHTGTLDPMAEGVLVICVGRATKLVDMITSYDKEYEAEIKLGIKTDTLDLEGKIIEEENINVSVDEIKAVINSFPKQYLQEVPIYSAVKIKGKKLYEYAREEKEVILPKREVNIEELQLIDDVKYEESKTIFKIRTKVSKGTYIRSLINDIASKLNTIGTMTKLVRTKQGNYFIDDTCYLDDFLSGNYKLITIKEIFKDIKQIKTNDKKIIHANVIDNIYNENKLLFLDENEEPIALYESIEDNKLKPTKVFKILN